MSKKSNAALFLLLTTLLTSPVHAQEAKTAETSAAESEAEITYPEEALRWLRAGKRFYEGGTRLVRKDHRQAKEAFEKAAEYNHPEALYYLGNLYQNGEDVPHDEDTAMDYYRKAANLGHPDAQMIVGVQHVMDGINEKPNSLTQQSHYAEAVKWLEKAAERGVPEAKFWYGDMLRKGLGTKKNEARGVTLIRESAQAGNPNGQGMLAALYWQGQSGVSKDLKEAYVWAWMSKQGGNQNADYLMDRIARGMSIAEVEAAIASAEAMQKSNKSE